MVIWWTVVIFFMSDSVSILLCLVCTHYTGNIFFVLTHTVYTSHNMLWGTLHIPFFNQINCIHFFIKILLGFFTTLQLQYWELSLADLGNSSLGLELVATGTFCCWLVAAHCMHNQQPPLVTGVLPPRLTSTSMSAIMRPQKSFARWWRPFSLKPSFSSSLPSSLDYRRVPNLPAGQIFRLAKSPG